MQDKTVLGPMRLLVRLAQVKAFQKDAFVSVLGGKRENFF